MLGAMGFGSGAFGDMSWGDGDGGSFALVSAMAIRENVVRLTFSAAIKFTGLLDPGDGSAPELYSVTLNDTNAVGIDGKPARQVNVATVARGPGLDQVDVTVDRSFSHFPVQYIVAVSGLTSIDGDPLGDDTLIVFDGLHRALIPNTAALAVPRRDIASPNDLEALAESEIPDIETAALGVFAFDTAGDYAADAGTTSFRKRVFRRCFTEPDSFAHLPGYGVGVLGMVKRLGRRELQQTTAHRAEQQILEEPEAVSASVSFVPDVDEPHLFRMVIRAQSKTGETVNESLKIGG